MAESRSTVPIQQVSTTPASGSATTSVSDAADSLAGRPLLNLKLTEFKDVSKDSDEPGKTSSKSASSNETSAPQKVLKPLKRRVLVFKASWCGACQSLNYEWPSLRKVRWRIGEKDTDHIQLVDADQHPELMARYGIASLPTLILVEAGRELGRQGSLGAINIAEFYYGRLK